MRGRERSFPDPMMEERKMSKQSLQALDEDSIPTETDLIRLAKELGGLAKDKEEEFKYEQVSFFPHRHQWFEEESNSY